MNKRLIVAAFCCISLLLPISCSTKRLADTVNVHNTNVEDIVQLMKKNQFRFTSLSLKFNAEAQSGEESNSFSGNIYMIKDSMIWVSVQKIGMEAFRLLITNDSVKMLDRINKAYIVGDYDVLNNMLKSKFDFDLLQALITGNDTDNYRMEGFVEKQENDYIILSYPNRKKQSAEVVTDSISQEIWLKAGEYKICKNILKEQSDNFSGTAEFDYSEFQDIDGQKFPQKIDFQLSDTRTFKGNIVFTRINPEKKETFPFTVPESYLRKY